MVLCIHTIICNNAGLCFYYGSTVFKCGQYEHKWLKKVSGVNLVAYCNKVDDVNVVKRGERNSRWEM